MVQDNIDGASVAPTVDLLNLCTFVYFTQKMLEEFNPLSKKNILLIDNPDIEKARQTVLQAAGRGQHFWIKNIEIVKPFINSPVCYFRGDGEPMKSPPGWMDMGITVQYLASGPASCQDFFSQPIDKAVALFGPPGIGKSTLVRRLARRRIDAVDLENVSEENRKRYLIYRQPRVIGAADLSPYEVGVGYLHVRLSLPDQKDLMVRRQARDAMSPGKAKQPFWFACPSDWVHMDELLTDRPIGDVADEIQRYMSQGFRQALGQGPTNAPAQTVDKAAPGQSTGSQAGQPVSSTGSSDKKSATDQTLKPIGSSTNPSIQALDQLYQTGGPSVVPDTERLVAEEEIEATVVEGPSVALEPVEGTLIADPPFETNGASSVSESELTENPPSEDGGEPPEPEDPCTSDGLNVFPGMVLEDHWSAKNPNIFGKLLCQSTFNCFWRLTFNLARPAVGDNSRYDLNSLQDMKHRSQVWECTFEYIKPAGRWTLFGARKADETQPNWYKTRSWKGELVSTPLWVDLVQVIQANAPAVTEVPVEDILLNQMSALRRYHLVSHDLAASLHSQDVAANSCMIANLLAKRARRRVPFHP